MGIDEGTVLRWLKSVGDMVRKDETIVEVETAKAVQEVQAPLDGKLIAILVQEGETAAVNTPLAILD